MHVIKQLTLFGITAFITLLLLEGYLRMAEVEAVSMSEFDPEVGRVMMPNRNFTYYNENFTVGSYNRYGYLGPAYPPQRADGTLRIALLGDSYVEGFQVQPRNHFRTLLEQQLQNTLVPWALSFRAIIFTIFRGLDKPFKFPLQGLGQAVVIIGNIGINVVF